MTGQQLIDLIQEQNLQELEVTLAFLDEAPIVGIHWRHFVVTDTVRDEKGKLMLNMQETYTH